jgi:uncharacterized protein YndB with AHSA1/START domain
MDMPGNRTVRVTADRTSAQVLASVEVAAPAARAFRALASADITAWWVRPGVFDTREWTGHLRVGGRWRAAGVGNGQPYVQEGEFLEVDPPRRLVHTWEGAARPGERSTLTYELEPLGEGTRITLRQAGFASHQACEAFAAGWQSSFERLAEILASDPAADERVR